jgi:hypothetical protein
MRQYHLRKFQQSWKQINNGTTWSDQMHTGLKTCTKTNAEMNFAKSFFRNFEIYLVYEQESPGWKYWKLTIWCRIWDILCQSIFLQINQSWSFKSLSPLSLSWYIFFDKQHCPEFAKINSEEIKKDWQIQDNFKENVQRRQTLKYVIVPVH